MNVNEIMKLLPHRYPFLLVDRVEEIEANLKKGIFTPNFEHEFYLIRDILNSKKSNTDISDKGKHKTIKN